MNKALETIADYNKVATDCAERSRNIAKEHGNAQTAMGMHHEGKSVAYNNAHTIMKAELRRLMNKFQNGSLNMDDFGVDP